MMNRALLAAFAAGTMLSCTSPVGESLHGASEGERNELLRAAILHAGFRCTQVLESAATPVEAAMSWRVICNDAQVFLASFEQDDRVEVQPMPYGDMPRRPDGRPADAPRSTEGDIFLEYVPTE